MVRAIRTATPRTAGRTAILTQIRAWAAATLLLLASFSAAAQRVEGDRARAEGIYATEVRVNGQGEAERLLGRRHFLERQAFAIARNKEPVLAFRIVEGEDRLGALFGGERIEKDGRCLDHVLGDAFVRTQGGREAEQEQG